MGLIEIKLKKKEDDEWIEMLRKGNIKMWMMRKVKDEMGVIGRVEELKYI